MCAHAFSAFPEPSASVAFAGIPTATVAIHFPAWARHSTSALRHLASRSLSAGTNFSSMATASLNSRCGLVRYSVRKLYGSLLPLIRTRALSILFLVDSGGLKLNL